ncbi:MAG: MarC family protein [Thermoanaerobaculia bacterium]
MRPYIESFLPLFVAINPLGIIPIYLSLTEKLSPGERRRLTLQAMMTALGLSIVILFAGQLIFSLLSITVNDLRVGGGLILLVLSISNVIFGDFRRRDPTQGDGDEDDPASVGIVPIGIPMIVGPAAITSILVSREAYGYAPTLVSLLINMVLVFLTLAAGPYIGRFAGSAGSRAIGKVASLFLAAISVAMIHAGIDGMIKG